MSLRVLLIDDNPERADRIAQALRDADCEILSQAPLGAPTSEHIERLNPDLVVVDLASPDRDALEAMGKINRDNPRPIVMFVDQGDEDFIADAVSAGVMTYVADGVNWGRVKPVVDLAMAQFRAFQALRKELDDAKRSLADRKIVDRAKGVIMKQRGCDENEAYRELRKLAMDRGLRIGQAAEQVMAIAKLLEK